MNRQQWEVQMLIGGEWENVWRDDAREDTPEGTPTRFPTREAARKALRDHRADMKDAGMEDGDSYRVAKVGGR